MAGLKSIYGKLKTATDSAVKTQGLATSAAAQQIVAATPFKPWAAPQQGTGLKDIYGNLSGAVGKAADAVAAKEEKDATTKLNAPTYQDVSSPYDQSQANAASQRATEAAKGQSYTPITSKFAGAGAYTQANASRAGNVLQQLYTGNPALNSTKGESGLSAGLAAQGGAAFGEEGEKARRENAQKAYEATNPEKVAQKLIGNLPTTPTGLNLDTQIQSMIAGDVNAAERMDRQARVNEALRKGNSDALIAEKSMALANPEYREGIRAYITDTAKTAKETAKSTLEANKEAAEGRVAGAKADVAKSNTDAATISAVNEIERALGKKATAAGGSASPEYVAQLRNEAVAAARQIESDVTKEAKKYGWAVRRGSDGMYRSINPALGTGAEAIAKNLNAKLSKRNNLQRMAEGAGEYSNYMDTSRSEQAKAQSELDKIASQYGRFS